MEIIIRECEALGVLGRAGGYNLSNESCGL
jgi:hypothetical protein